MRSKLRGRFTRWLYAAAFSAMAMGTATTQAQVSPSAGMMKNPDVSQSHIVFSYADDLWIVDREGGTALPLASPAGVEGNPRFSPDGKTVAFEANYDGGSDLYTMPVNGGVVTRMTFHPGQETLCDWNPANNALVFDTNAYSGLGRMTQLMTVSESQPLPSALPVPYGSNAAVSEDGKWLAYTPHSRDGRTWKRYRGGMASDIWLFHLENHTAKQITDFEGTDSYPMWHGKKIYYLSDAGPEHRLNVWMYDTESEERSQVTKFADYDCKTPAIGPGPEGQGEIVLQNGKAIYLVNLADQKVAPVSIQIPGDRPSLKNELVDASKQIRNRGLSPSAKRVVLEARGDVWTVPVKNGSPRNLTATSGAHERDPAWSPDGRWIAYLSDATGEYELYLTQSDGRGETRQLTKGGSAFRYSPTWSPDSKYLVFNDKTGSIYTCSVADGTIKKVAQDPQGAPQPVSWSHNSQWLTFALSAKEMAGSAAIWVYQVEDGTMRKLTEGFFGDSNPVFDRKGDYIYFSSNRAFNRPQYEDVGTTFIYAGTEVLMAMPLRPDVKLPLLPEVDEETWKKDKPEQTEEEGASEEQAEKPAKSDADEPKDAGDDKKDVSPKAGEEKNEQPKPFEIVFDGAEARSFQVPVEQGNFGQLGVNDKGHLIFARRAPRGARGESGIFLIDLTADEPKQTEVVADMSGYSMNSDGSKLLVGRGSSMYVIEAKPGQKPKDAISTDGMMVNIDPKAEWKQIFHEAWRLERDFFYDPNMHGVNWPGVRDHYAAMLDDCVSRRDLSYLIREMIAELNVGHAYYREADLENGPSPQTGVFGCSFAVDGEHLKIDRIFQGAAWDFDARSSLTQAGVKEGHYLLEINGQPVTAQTNPYAMVQGQRGSTITLTVSDDKELDDKDPRVPIVMSGSDSDLRFRHWIESKRKYVEEATDGKVGYIYVVNTGVPGQNDLFRQFYGQAGKQALIVDDRWNGGGQIPTRFIELLNRPVTNYWARRDAIDWTWPPDSHQGPKCMLINGLAGSGGDMFPALFKQNKLGKLVGMRTWGGLVGISGSPTLIDGASVTAPSFAYYETDGTWGIEGHGVDPDIPVVDDPEKMANGKDPQLDAAIELMLKEISENGYQPPNRPAYPDRKGFGIKPEDK